MLYGFLSNTYVSLPTYERLEKVKDNLISMGISIKIYWLGNILSDLILFTTSITFLTITVFIMKIKFITDNYGEFLLIMYAFCFATMGFGYVL